MEEPEANEFLLIRNVDLGAGFTALILYALNGVRKALQTRFIPVVYFDKKSTFHFYDKKYGENIWEYFFEPVADVSYDKLKEWTDTKRVKKRRIHKLSEKEIYRGHHHETDRLATFWAWKEPGDKEKWMSEKRELGRSYIKNYLRVKPHIQDKVTEFVKQTFTSDYVFGVHIRGTDFAYAQPTGVNAYFEELDRLISQRGDGSCQVFLATDQIQFVNQFQARYGDKLIVYAAIRSDNDTAPFRLKGVSNYKKGEDVLIDILLLSKCNYLLKGAAAVGEMALWFNESLECTDFGLKSQFDQVAHHKLKSAYLKLNVDNKDPKALTERRRKRMLVDYLFNTPVMRVLLKHYHHFKNR